MTNALRLALGCTALAGCGYVGDPLPPALHIPEAVRDFRVMQQGSEIVVDFTAPTLTTELLPVKLGKMELLGDSPAAEWAEPFQDIAAETGARVRATFPVSHWRPGDVRFRVRGYSTRGRAAEWSNPVVITLGPPVPPPAGLRAEPSPQGVQLTWNSAESGTAFEIHRKSTGDKEPLPIGRVESPTYLDTAAEFSKTYEYAVQAITKRGAAEARSTLSTPATLTYVDKFGPAAPSGLSAVAGLGTVEIAWAPPSDSDLRGYRLYRAAGDAAMSLLVDSLTVPTYGDRAVAQGTKYRYSVSAVDALGNEGERSAEIIVAVP